MDEPPQAHDELTAILWAALPETWRHATKTVRSPEGIEFHFRDANGRPHILDARPRALVPSAPVTGEVLGYSYTNVDPAIDEAALLDEYRAVLSALAAREGEILPWMTPDAQEPTPAGDKILPQIDPVPQADTPRVPAALSEAAAAPLADERPAAPELTALLRNVLPEPWRHAVEATLSPAGGFLLRFRDAEGHQHALDARDLGLAPSAFVSGRALGYSYTLVDLRLTEDALLDGYRAVLTEIAERESEVLPWLAPARLGEVEGLPNAEPSRASWKGLPPNERPAPSELAAIAREALPEAWRHALTVSLTQGGFVMQFVDEKGARHALDAREIRPEAPTLVSGRVLAFSYLFVEGGAEETALAGEYRAVLSRLAARESDILPWIDSAPPADGPSVPAAPSEEAAAPLPDEHPAPPELTALLRGALPEPWRHAVEVTLSPAGGFFLRFRDAEGRQHALEGRELRFAPTAFVSGRALGYSYTLVDLSVAEGAVLDGYRAVLTEIAAREGEVLPWLAPALPDEAEGQPNAELSAPSWKGPFPNERAAPPELAAIAREALPEAWRHDLAVSLTPAGFILRFRDEAGARHAFDARRGRSDEPSLVRGRVLAFSYLSLEEGAEEVSLAGEYRVALSRLAARESEVLPWLPLAGPTGGPGDSSWKGPFPDEELAPPEFEALAAGALPEAWRRDMAAVITEAGFTLRFRDEAGARHAFDAREIRESEPALVRGHVLYFSHASLEEGAGEVPLTDALRGALHALAAREADLLPWLSFALRQRALPPEPGHEASQPGPAALDGAPDNRAEPLPEDAFAHHGAPELAAILRDLLPERWRHGVTVASTPSGFILRFRDEDGVERAFDARELRPGEPAMIRGSALVFSYLPLKAGEVEDVERINAYRTVLGGFAAREADILPWIQRDAPSARSGRDALPGDLQHLRGMVFGIDDATMYEGIGRVGIDVAITHVCRTMLPGAAAAQGGERGTVQFTLRTPDGERHLWIACTGARVETGIGRAEAAQADAAMSFADFLRLFVSVPGKDAEAQMAAGSLAVTGDTALVRALPGWFRLPS